MAIRNINKTLGIDKCIRVASIEGNEWRDEQWKEIMCVWDGRQPIIIHHRQIFWAWNDQENRSKLNSSWNAIPSIGVWKIESK